MTFAIRPSQTRPGQLRKAARSLYSGQTQTARGARASIGVSVMVGGVGYYGTGLTIHALKQAKRGASVYRRTVGPITRIASAYSSVESVYKLRKGGYRPAFSTSYVPMDPYWQPVAPHIGPIPLVERRLELGAEKIQSRGGEHTASSGTPRTSTRKSMRGPSAYEIPQHGYKKVSGRRGPCDPGYVLRKKNGRWMCVRKK